MPRAPCCDERLALKKGPWTPDEDQKLVAYIQDHGHGNWRALPEKAGLARCGKSCRLRWTNYLRPDIKRGRFTGEEEQTIIQLHSILGNRWSAIASHLPRRTDNEIKNYWNTHLKKRLAHMGIDPVTHKASAAGLALSPAWTPLASTRLSHLSQWEIALAEAQTRLSTTKPAWPPRHSDQRHSDHFHSLHRLLPHHLPPQLPPHPSSLFMRSWTTTPKSEPENSSLKASIPKADAVPSFSTAMVKIDESFPDHETKAEIFSTSRCSMFNYNHEQSSGREDVAIENLFSPTSILQGPDSESCSSASGNHNMTHPDFFATLLRHSSAFQSSGFQSLGFHSSGFQSFPVHDEVSDDIPETFWQDAGEALLEDESAHSEECLQLELLAPLDFAANGGDAEFPPFDSLCHGAQ